MKHAIFAMTAERLCYRVNLSVGPPTTQTFKGIDQKTSVLPGVRGIKGIIKRQMTGN